jgi:hypothetical protein
MRLTHGIAQEKYWTLSKSPLPGFRHEFFTLKNGLKLHYVVNAHDEAVASGNIAIFIHGKLRQLHYSPALLPLARTQKTGKQIGQRQEGHIRTTESYCICHKDLDD